MKVFVTGATGVLGQRVVQKLINQNISIVALSRSHENSRLLKNRKLLIKEVDLFNRDEMKEATKGCNAILHLATHIPKKTMPKISDWEMNDEIRINGTANLIEAAKANKIEIFICPSVTALYAQQYGNFVSSQTPLPEKQVASVISAIKMEKLIFDQLPGKYVIIRFGNFYSADDFHTRNLIGNIIKGRMPMIGNGKFYVNYIHLDDAADAIVFSLNNFKAVKGNIVNATDYNPVLYSDMIESLYPVAGNKKPFHLSMFLAKWLLGKTSFSFLTNSYRIKHDPLLTGWKPKHTDFINSMSEIIKQSILWK